MHVLFRFVSIKLRHCRNPGACQRLRWAVLSCLVLCVLLYTALSCVAACCSTICDHGVCRSIRTNSIFFTAVKLPQGRTTCQPSTPYVFMLLFRYTRHRESFVTNHAKGRDLGANNEFFYTACNSWLIMVRTAHLSVLSPHKGRNWHEILQATCTTSNNSQWQTRNIAYGFVRYQVISLYISNQFLHAAVSQRSILALTVICHTIITTMAV